MFAHARDFARKFHSHSISRSLSDCAHYLSDSSIIRPDDEDTSVADPDPSSDMLVGTEKDDRVM